VYVLLAIRHDHEFWRHFAIDMPLSLPSLSNSHLGV
jgi:hypothetical protein